MATSSGEFQPSLEQMKEQLAIGSQHITKPTPSLSFPTLFHGIIQEILLAVEEEEDDVEKDGGGISKPKQTGPPPSSSSKVFKSIFKRKSQDITIKDVPYLTQAGKMNVEETGETIEFYYGRQVLEATDTGDVKIEPVFEGPKQEAKFTLTPKAKVGDSYKLVNKIDCCICLSLENSSKVQLVSLSEDEIKRHDTTKIVQYITIFESSDNLLALFFTHQNPSKRLFNYYLSPADHASSDHTFSVEVINVDVTGFSDDQQIATHRKYLFFSNNPQSEQDYVEHPHAHRLLMVSGNHDNSDSTFSLESSDKSRDSGCGQSVKSGANASGGEEH